jgi:alpha-mannosidase
MAKAPDVQFESELVNADLKSLKQAILWRLSDIRKACEGINSAVQHLPDSSENRESLQNTVRELTVILPKLENIHQLLSD